MKRKLDRFKELDETLVKTLSASRVLTVEDVLSRTMVELVQGCGILEADARLLIRTVSESVVPRVVSVGQLVGTRHVKTGLEPLDAMLGGGIAARGITEVVGPPGAGKTQFCHGLAVMATMPINMGGLFGKVLYIDTEGAFTAERLLEIAQNRFPAFFAAKLRLDSLASSVLVHVIKNSAELMALLKEAENIVIGNNVKLIILDSVASVVRREFDSKQMKERQMLLVEQSQMLKQLAERFDIPVLVSNQVSGKMAATGSNNVTAALGALWAHAVNTRLVLENRGSSGGRHLYIAKSPRCPVCSLSFRITFSGIVTDDVEMEGRDGNYFGFGGGFAHVQDDD